ncbi:allantoinase, mitochondrial isoform X2 [Episyrphus balteatus]|uniref:allantoinase, mitochondrial isoform X2 n=1 Tax=Episyrphus balteatus TaxID=286459 RepID=UPI002484E21B|nr:allantoinase, mitochondrial isoform X2 [Episyrphus balteatus]
MDILFISKRIYLGKGDGFINGGIIVSTEGIIQRILKSSQEVNSYMYNTESESVIDFENMVLMPGLIDTNVHINEPGRKDWEGFLTATKAAAAGGFTTIIDRATNAIPPTTNAANLKTKTSIARGKIYVDIGFWGGIVPGNFNELPELASSGVIGFHCSLCPTNLPEFEYVTKEQVKEAIDKLDDGAIIAFHAEMEKVTTFVPKPNDDNVKSYESFLKTRPPSMEIEAVSWIADLAECNKKKHFHILNLSAAETIPIIEKSQKNKANLTAETCHHYLTLCAEDVEDCHTVMCESQANMCGIQNFKGKIEEGYDADFCVWDPEEEFLVSPEIIQFRNKANPYMNTKLRGVVHATVVRGLHVFQKYEGFGQPLGKVILRKTSKKVVKFVRL